MWLQLRTKGALSPQALSQGRERAREERAGSVPKQSHTAEANSWKAATVSIQDCKRPITACTLRHTVILSTNVRTIVYDYLNDHSDSMLRRLGQARPIIYLKSLGTIMHVFGSYPSLLSGRLPLGKHRLQIAVNNCQSESSDSCSDIYGLTNRSASRLLLAIQARADACTVPRPPSKAGAWTHLGRLDHARRRPRCDPDVRNATHILITSAHVHCTVSNRCPVSICDQASEFLPQVCLNISNVR